MINHVMYLSHNFLCAYFSLTKKKKKKKENAREIFLERVFRVFIEKGSLLAAE